MCSRANPIQMLLVIVISLLDIVIIRAPIVLKFWIFDLLWPHNFIFYNLYISLPVEFDKEFDYTYENICIDNVYSHILDVVTMNLMIYIGYSHILDIVTYWI